MARALVAAIALAWVAGVAPAQAEGWRAQRLPPEATAAGAEVVAVAGSRDTLVLAVRQGELTTLLSSVDGVQTWQLLARPMREVVRGLATRGGVVLVAVENAWGGRDLWSTSLNVGPWDRVVIRGAAPSGVTVVAADSDRVWASDGAAIWRSPNGRQWLPVAGGGAGPAERVTGLVPTDDGVLVTRAGPPSAVAHLDLSGASEVARQGDGACGAGAWRAWIEGGALRVGWAGRAGQAGQAGVAADLGRATGCVGIGGSVFVVTERGLFEGRLATGDWERLALDGVVRVVVYHGWLFALTRVDGGPPALWRWVPGARG